MRDNKSWNHYFSGLDIHYNDITYLYTSSNTIPDHYHYDVHCNFEAILNDGQKVRRFVVGGWREFSKVFTVMD